MAAMGKQSLVIVESPAKASTIKKFLGKDYKVLASVGHVMDLPKNELGVDIGQRVLAEVRRLARQAEGAHADQEGRQGGGPGSSRARYGPRGRGDRVASPDVPREDADATSSGSSSTKSRESAILEAVENPTDVDQRKVDAQQARRILDRLVGYQISPILWKIFYYGLSAGSVQTVGLRLVCETRSGDRGLRPGRVLDGRRGSADARRRIDPRQAHARSGAHKADLKKKEEVDPIVDELRKSVLRRHRGRAKGKAQKPAAALHHEHAAARRGATASLFAEEDHDDRAAALRGRSTSGTASGSGSITYMRTDSVRISVAGADSAREYIAETFGKEFIPTSRRGPTASARRRRTRTRRSGPPTSTARPESVKEFLKKDQYALYDLIWRRFVASQMASARYDTTEVVDRRGATPAQGQRARADLPRFSQRVRRAGSATGSRSCRR